MISNAYSDALVSELAEFMSKDDVMKRLKSKFSTARATSYLELVCSNDEGLCVSGPENIQKACEINVEEKLCKRATRTIVEMYCAEHTDSKACAYLTFFWDLNSVLIGAGIGALVIALLLTIIFIFIYRRKVKKLRGVSGATINTGTNSTETAGGSGTATGGGTATGANTGLNRY